MAMMYNVFLSTNQSLCSFTQLPPIVPQGHSLGPTDAVTATPHHESSTTWVAASHLRVVRLGLLRPDALMTSDWESGLKMPNPNDKNKETVDSSSNTDVPMENTNISDPHIIPFDSENGMKME
ncbi:hypothetical protein AVEN_89559-1 [Araneus ventricosus]|uniref:Uncharacterized protein n=1 Tax=Araneus ventricosus TaxID=182803 RepID=A0A4Y2GUS3_ARAVE|nr:hypothetical protein AVEN_89559-1 [Araneus ventricosus]